MKRSHPARSACRGQQSWRDKRGTRGEEVWRLLTVVIVTTGLSSGSRAEATAAIAPAAVVRMLDVADWRIDRDRPPVPRIEVVHKTGLEVFDGVEWAIRGGDVRLYTSRANHRQVFAAVFGSGQAAQARAIRSNDRRDVVSFGDCTVVLPSRVLSPRDFDELKGRRWTRDALRKRWGAWSYWQNIHGVGQAFLTYVPEGFDVGLAATNAGIGQYYLIDLTRDWSDEFGWIRNVPSDAAPVSYADYLRTRRSFRRGVARILCEQRKRIERQLADGLRSPDGRFVVAPVNVGGTYNTQETAIREGGRPERRYPAGYFTRLQDYCWLDERTVLYQVVGPLDLDVYTLDGPTGKMNRVLHVDEEHVGGRVGCLPARRFWYTTRDGVRHEQAVPVAGSEMTQLR